MEPFITTVTQKGQVTIPLAIRKQAKLSNRTRALVKYSKGKVTIEPVVDFLDLAGTIKPIPGKSVMDARKEMEEHYERF